MNLIMTPNFQRWLAALFAAIVLALVGAGIWFYQSQHRIAQRNAEASLQTIAQLKVDQIVQWRNERLADAAQLMESPFLTGAVAQWLKQPEPKLTAELLARFRAARKHLHYGDVTLVDTNRQVRLSLSGQHGPLPPAAMAALNIAFQGQKPVLSELLASPGNLPSHLDVISPLIANNAGADGLCGAILLQCDAREFLYPLIQSWPLPNTSAEMLLVRRDGDAALCLSELRHQPGTALKLRLPLTQTNAVAVMAALGRTGLVQGRDDRGVNYVAIIKAVPDSPWLLAAKVDARDVFAAWHFRSALILALIFGFIIGAAIIAQLAWQRTTRHYRYTRNLIEASLDPLVAVNPELRILDVNAATEQAIGRSRDELVGTDFATYFIDPPKVRNGGREVFRNGAVRNFPLELCHHDGQVASVLCNISVYRREWGRTRCALAAIRDITERQRMDTAFRRVHRAHRVISACNQALVRAGDEFELLNEVCRLIVEDGGFCFAWVGFAEADKAKTVKPVAYSGHEAGYLSTINITWSEDANGHGPTGTAIRTGKPAICRNALTDPNFSPWRDEALKRGYASSIVLPLLDQGRAFGALSIYATEIDAFATEDVQLLTQLADDLAYGVLSLRVRFKHQQAEAEIRKLNVELEQRVQERTRELAESEERLWLVLQASLTGTFEVDFQTGEGRWNDIEYALLGLKPGEVPPVPESFFRFVHPDDVKSLRMQWEEALQVGRLDAEFRVVRSDGQVRWLAGKGQLVSHTRAGKNGEMPGRWRGQFLGVNYDISDRKHAQERIQKINEQLQQRAVLLESANKELESFSYSVSHDLRAPLRAIDGFSRIVLENCAPQLSDEDRQNLERVRAATLRMGDLIDDLLKLSRISRSELHASRLDLSGLAAAAADDLRQENANRAVEFVITPGLAGDGDARLIRIVLDNLLGNAWKFTAKQPAARIEFGAVVHEDSTAYFVRDNGDGFDMAYVNKLFAAFQRLHTTAEFPGTGIGLATVRRIIHRHGGRVWAESKPGHETTFYFTLPDQPKDTE